MIAMRALIVWLLCAAAFPGTAPAAGLHAWSEEERKILASLWLGSLPPPPADPSNKYAADPQAAVLGQKLFFDHRLSGNGNVACATCHAADQNFTDRLALARGMGTTTRRSMPLIGMAYDAWYFWDGRKDSLWSQALAPLESPVEHGFTRTQCVAVIMEHYREEYETIFGPLAELDADRLPPNAKPSPDDPSALKAWMKMPREEREAVNRIYANMGKAIAAFVRTILPTPARFDRYAEAALKKNTAAMKSHLSDEEVKGLRLFIGKAKCINCHAGPLFTNGGFHRVGVAAPAGLPADRGRAAGIVEVLGDPFNCLGPYSDAAPRECGELRFIDTDTNKYEAAFKTPTLRNVAERTHFMHAGQFGSLSEVLRFYRDLAPGQRAPDLEHGGLSDAELDRLEAFLRTLSAPLRFAGTPER